MSSESGTEYKSVCSCRRIKPILLRLELTRKFSDKIIVQKWEIPAKILELYPKTPLNFSNQDKTHLRVSKGSQGLLMWHMIDWALKAFQTSTLQSLKTGHLVWIEYQM